MRSERFGLLIYSLFLAVPVWAQQTQTSTTTPRQPQRDLNALQLLTKLVNAAGGADAIGRVIDITGTGNVTFYWGDHPTGAVTVRTRVNGGFRVDSFLSKGNLTWMTNGKSGSRREIDGSVRKMPYQNAINHVNFSFPIGHAISASNDVSAEVIGLGLETRAETGKQVYRVRIRRELAPGYGLDNIKSKLTTRDLLIDPTSFEIVCVQDNPYIREKPADSGPREIEFSDYRVVQGVRVPFAISTTLGSQRTMDIKLDSITLNTGIADSDFEK